MARTRKIVMTIFCLPEDVEGVQDEFTNCFGESDHELVGIKFEVSESTEEEDKEVCDELEIYNVFP
jgi:hypothetical protein